MIASRDEGRGATGELRREDPSRSEEQGKQLFIQNCKSCHTLEAVNAHGVTGPNLDELGGVDKQRVLRAIKRGGTGDGRMPPGAADRRGRGRRGHLRGQRRRPLSRRPARARCKPRCISPASTGLFRPDASARC